MVNYYNLAQNRIFYINEEIDENVLEIQKAIIHINIIDREIDVDKRAPIYIFINTCGGLLQETMSLAQSMIMSKTPVVTVFADDNKKYLSTDLGKTIEPNKKYISNKIELLDYEVC